MQPNKDIIKADLDRYMNAFTSWDNCGFGICCAIEQKYNLYGYPPSVVTAVLAAGAEGKDMVKAEDTAIGN